MIRQTFLGFALTLAFATTAHADAVPVPAPTTAPAPSKFQNAVGNGVLQFIKNRGFAANDPRVYQTLVGVSKALSSNATYIAGAAGAAGGTALAVGTSPAWLSVLGGAVITAGLTYAIPIIADGTIKWVFGPGPTPVGVATATNDYSAWIPLAANGQPAGCSIAYNVYNWCNTTNQNPDIPQMCISHAKPYNPTLACKDGYAQTVEGALEYNGYKAPEASGTPNKTMDQAVSALTPPQLTQPISAEVIAALVNTALQQATADGEYTGIPFSPADAVTPAQINAAKPVATEWPSLGDAVAPQPKPETAFQPAVPASSSSTSVGGSPAGSTTAVSPTATKAPDAIKTAPTGTAKVDLGPDPGIRAPTLEETPTAEMIMAPLLDLMPGLKDFAVPAHQSVCPIARFDALGNTFVIDSHCTLFDQNKSIIFAAMMLCFGISSVIIILKA